MADDYAKLRTLDKKLKTLAESESDAIESVKARFQVKREGLEKERAEIAKRLVQ